MLSKKVVKIIVGLSAAGLVAGSLFMLAGPHTLGGPGAVAGLLGLVIAYFVAFGWRSTDG